MNLSFRSLARAGALIVPAAAMAMSALAPAQADTNVGFELTPQLSLKCKSYTDEALSALLSGMVEPMPADLGLSDCNRALGETLDGVIQAPAPKPGVTGKGKGKPAKGQPAKAQPAKAQPGKGMWLVPGAPGAPGAPGPVGLPLVDGLGFGGEIGKALGGLNGLPAGLPPALPGMPTGGKVPGLPTGGKGLPGMPGLSNVPGLPGSRIAPGKVVAGKVLPGLPGAKVVPAGRRMAAPQAPAAPQTAGPLGLLGSVLPFDGLGVPLPMPKLPGTSGLG